MRKQSSLKKRVLAFLLALILSVPANAGDLTGILQASAAEAGDDQVMTGNNVSTTGKTTDVAIAMDWDDSEFKDGTSFNLYEDTYTSKNLVKLRISYGSEHIREAGYAPGELIITVKGIGNVNRNGVLEALVGADKDGTAVKTHDWTYTWNRVSDTYTFKNNEAIEPNSVFSGYFELVWTIVPRDSVHLYKQDNVQAVLYLPDGEIVETPALAFTNTTVGDVAEVEIERGPMYSAEGLTAGIENPEDYYFVRYYLGSLVNNKTRGLTSSYHVFHPDSTGVSQGAIVISPILDCEAQEDGSYRVSLDVHDLRLGHRVDLEDQYVFVAYPASYRGKTATATIQRFGSYYEYNDAGYAGVHELAADQYELAVPQEFEFDHIPGDIYAFEKDDYFDKYVQPDVTEAKGGDVNGAKLVSGTQVRFYFDGVLINKDAAKFDMEMVDDFLYILGNDGEYRQLQADEYDFEKVTIPGTGSLKNFNGVSIQKDTYVVKVYAAQKGAVIHVGNAEQLIFEGKITNASQTVTFPKETTAIAVVLEDVTESIASFSIPVYVNFHIHDTSELEWIEQDNLETGHVINTAFIKFYGDIDSNQDGVVEENVWMNDYFGPETYLDDTLLKLADKDVAIYGHTFDRERETITLYPGEKNDFSATVGISGVKETDGLWRAKFNFGARFGFVEEDLPQQFSLYTILPELVSLDGYRNPEDIWDILTLSGMELTAEELAAACTPEVIENYQDSGRTYVALHFDFGSAQVPQKGSIQASLAVRADQEALENAKLPLRSAVLIDSSVPQYKWGKVIDDGKWGDNAALFADIDRDGNGTELLARAVATYTPEAIADSSQFQLSKYVYTTASDMWTQKPTTEEFGGGYRYRIALRNGNSLARHIVITDILETGTAEDGAVSQWQGKLLNVDLSACEELGLTGTVYYSASAQPGHLDSGNWTTEKPADVKAVTVDFGESELPAGATLSIILEMQAPDTDLTLLGKAALNSYTASLTMYDLSTGNETLHADQLSNTVQVRLTQPLRSIIVAKADAEDTDTLLSGAVFALLDAETQEEVARVTSNARGYAIFRNLPVGKTYILREITAPYGYETADDVEITLTEDDYRVTVNDPRKTGTLKVCKTNNLDETIKVAGATYTLYDASGNQVATAVTDENGVATFNGIIWGSYTVKETQSPDGYQLNDTEYPVEINRETVSELTIVDTVDVQDDVYVCLTKYVKDVAGNPTAQTLSGVPFELFRKTAAGDRSMGIFVTDRDGKIEVSQLPYGQYYFREYRVPTGYTGAEDVAFTLDPQNKEQYLTAYNQRKPGAVTVIKTDNLGNLVQGVEFTLYAADQKTVLATATTDKVGVLRFNDLEWGTYYLRETKAPKYYVMDTQWIRITVGATTLTHTVNHVNETVKGAVRLIKADADGQTRLQGAEYALYTTDNKLIGTYTTDENGEIYVDNLEWGGYYFKETKAPEGYGLSSETVRFSVNSINAGVAQEITVIDQKESLNILLTKRIKAADINFANGDPTFTFKLEGTDSQGNRHTYYQMVTFNAAYVGANTDADGYVSQTVIFADIMAGTYTAAEMETSRYYLESITNVVNGTPAEDGKSVTFTLSTEEGKKEASATFTNQKYEHQDFSDNQNLNNIIKTEKKLTAIKAEYFTDTVDVSAGESGVIDRSKLVVTAMYDDGSTRVLENDAYLLSMEDLPKEDGQYYNGTYTIVATYTENSIVRTANFVITVVGGQQLIVKLEAKYKGTGPVPVYSELTVNMFEVYAVYNTGERQLLQYKLAEVEGAATATITSPRWPNNYLNGMKETEDYWEQSFPGAEAVLVTFDAASCLQGGGGDWIQIYDSTGVSVAGKLFGTEFAGKTYTVTGNYVKLAMQSNNVVTQYDRGFSATLTPLYPVPDEYTIDPAVAPDTPGDFDVTISLNLDAFENRNLGVDVSTTASVEAEYRDPLLVPGPEFRDTIPAAATKVVFTDAKPPVGAALADISVAQDMSVLAWLEGTTYYVSSHQPGVAVIANENSSYMFQSNSALTQIDFAMLNTSQVTNMHHMFHNCHALIELDLSGFDTGKVTNMSWMFGNCGKLTKLVWDADRFDTGEVTDVQGMFYGCSALKTLDVSGFKTGKMENMSQMFFSCSGLTELDVSHFDTGNVTNMSSMFYGCGRLTELDFSSFDTGNVTNMSSMFYGCGRLTELDVSHFDTGNVTSMMYMFRGCSSLTELDLSSFDTGKVTNMSYMFYNCSGLTELDLSSFDTGNVTSMMYMFLGCSGLTELDLSSFDTGKVTNMSYMFYNCSSLTELDVSSFDTSEVTNMGSMFYGCSGLTELDVSSFDTSKVMSMGMMFYNCKGLTELDVSHFDTGKVTGMGYMFNLCSGLTELDVSNFDTSKVTNMMMMFRDNPKLKTLDLSNFNTSNVTNMSYMFSGCSGLTELDVSSFDTSNVTSMTDMFYGCSSLTELDLSSFDTAKVTNMNSMFAGCTAIGKDAEGLDRAYARTIADAEKLNASSGKPTTWQFHSVAPAFTPETLTLTYPTELVTIDLPAVMEGGVTVLQMIPLEEGKILASFTLNGEKIAGDSFVVPVDGVVTITDVILVTPVVIESEHNPYPNGLYTEKVYGEAQFEGATSLTVVLDYQTARADSDYVRIFDAVGNWYASCGGPTRTTVTVTVPGDYVKITFRTDVSGNNYYGFKAVITPNYD